MIELWMHYKIEPFLPGIEALRPSWREGLQRPEVGGNSQLASVVADLP